VLTVDMAIQGCRTLAMCCATLRAVGWSNSGTLLSNPRTGRIISREYSEIISALRGSIEICESTS
jgi:hypothetical protein